MSAYRTITENTIVKMLQDYMKKEEITQTELAERLGWSAQDVNDTLKGRKAIGKNRQAHIAGKLGISFESVGGVIVECGNAGKVRESQTIPYGLTDDDIAVARLINKQLTKRQKEALKIFIQSIPKS